MHDILAFSQFGVERNRRVIAIVGLHINAPRAALTGQSP
jgi:hypothetical protein